MTTPVAIIGIGSIFPQARTTQEYWDNILRKIDCVTEVPPSRWSIDDYYDPDPSAKDKTYCKWGGFIPDIEFDPMEFGLPPNILEVTDVSQLLALVVAKEALENAGYGEQSNFDREHTGCVLGFVGTSSKLYTPLMTRLQYPVWAKVLRSAGISEADTGKIIEKMKLAYVNWEENSFPGTIGNVVAGRICNRFDLGGMNCVVDAACASSLAAVKMAVGELVTGRANMMLAGGVDTDNSINTYMCFSKTPAFTSKEKVRPFDAALDGMMVGEGLGMMVLKRLEDAERDGDRVYAVIRAIGASSDGRFKSIYAPRPAGQAKAMLRAYEEAGFEPASVGLIEAHGTGTMAGDPAEFEGLNEVFSANNPRKQHIALGSVKSQIAHTKAAAGVASLIKTSLALYHKILPPTINVDQPNPKLNIAQTPFYLNTEPRPWIRARSAAPRRAGVSSFGFGGTNYHVVLEENESEQHGSYRLNNVPQAILLSALDPAQLLALCQKETQNLQDEGALESFSRLVQSSRSVEIPPGSARLGFVAQTIDEARQALQVCSDTLSVKIDQESWEHPQGIYYRRNALETRGKVVALFSGQGTQYLNMGRELAMNFPPVRDVFAALDDQFLADGLEPLSGKVYPRPVFDEKERAAQAEELTRTEHAQPAIGALSMGLYKLLQEAGFQPDFTAGHSFGELTALWAAGVLSDDDYLSLAKARGKAMAPPADGGFDAGMMAAVKGDVGALQSIFKDDPDITLANWNSLNQVVIAGTKPAIGRAQERLAALGFQVTPLQVSAAFHTPLVSHAQKPFAEAIAHSCFNQPKTRVFSNSTGQEYSTNPEEIRKVLAAHILKPVLFRDEIENIYAAGGSIFVEFGPKNVLTNLVENILAGKPHLAVALNANAKKDSDRQLRSAVIMLRVAGLLLENFDPYARVSQTPKPVKKSPVMVTLNGGYYVSEKTRQAFENALSDGFRIRLPGAGQENQSALPGNTFMGAEAANPLAVGQEPAMMKTVEEPYRMNTYPSQHDETVLSELQAHEAEVLRLHEQYLRIEEEYVRALSQVTSLQTELVKKSAGDLSAVLPLFESLERSMTRFHDHQAETLQVHRHYLETQEAISQLFLPGAAAPVAGQEPAAAVPAPATVTTQPIVENRPVLARLEHPSPAAYPKSNGHAAQAAAVMPHQPIAPEVQPERKPAAPTPLAAGDATIDPSGLREALLEIVSEKTGYQVETLEMDMDMEADLGIDSIKRVEILGAMQARFPELPKIETAVLADLHTLGQIVETMGAGTAVGSPSTSGAEVDVRPGAQVDRPATAADTHLAVGLSEGELAHALLQIVSEKTGYPPETLELNMDMEADLGIDSIKRVEILGAMQDRFPALPKLEAAALAELRTLGQIISQMNQAQPVSPLSPSVGGTAQSPFDFAVNQPLDLSRAVRKILPPPDRMEFRLPEGHSCLVTDDGSPLTGRLVQQLSNLGWPVVVMRFPGVPALHGEELPSSTASVELLEFSEAVLQASLENISLTYGPIAVFIHLSPAWKSASELGVNSSPGEKELLKMVFLAAKHLKATLTGAGEQGRAAFFTVTRLDGEFGLSQEADFSPVSGGLLGLAKTLKLEWNEVHCRALDLSPILDAQQAAGCILAELHDPNRLISEVGYTLTDRSTLALAPLALPVPIPQV